MRGWLYLIRNRDLHKIGITKHFDKRMRQLKPDKVVAKLYTSDFVKLEKELHNRYKKLRIPQTEYFRLEDFHLKEIKQRISELSFSKNIILRILIKSILVLLLIYFHILVFISLINNDINTIFIQSLYLMERISFGISILSILFNSGKYLSLFSELRYRFLRLIIYILLAIIFRTASLFSQNL